MSRWRAAIHEASHCIAAIVLGGRCKSLALYSDDSGLARLYGLARFDHVVAVAAASEAESLLADEPPPNPEPASTHDRRETCDLSLTEGLAVWAARSRHETTATDEQTIGWYCVNGVEDEPGRWVDRYYLVHETARRVVADHTRQILTVARELFLRGVLSEHEIQEELKQ